MPLCSHDALADAYDVCVVGAGPAGLATALDCAARGLRVLLLEAGGHTPVPGTPDVIAADISESRFHDPPDIISAAALGGTSHWWGGRCVPFDASDFAGWPLSYDDLAPWYEKAGAFFGARGVFETPAPGAFARLADFTAEREETWCPEIAMSKRWAGALRAGDGPVVVCNARVTALEISDGAITGVCVDARRIKARHVVLACGGLGTLRLLLMAQRQTPALFGGAEGALGRDYMGHLTGVIADLCPADRADADAFAFRDLGGHVDARRRITARAAMLARENLPNIAFWIDNAYNENPAHGSSVASAKYVAARVARMAASLGRARDAAPIAPHLRNIARAPFSAMSGLAHALILLANARITGHLPRSRRFTPASPGGWLMRYHGEQRPDPANRVRLGEATDSIGLPRLAIDFRFSDDACEAVVRAHELLDRDLQTSGAGRLRWHAPRADCIAVVRDYARDGYHQIGGAIMSADPGAGVVDAHCRAHGLSNLWLATSAVFPTGGQANPTLTIVALALRTADALASAAAPAAA